MDSSGEDQVGPAGLPNLGLPMWGPGGGGGGGAGGAGGGWGFGGPHGFCKTHFYFIVTHYFIVVVNTMYECIQDGIPSYL